MLSVISVSSSPHTHIQWRIGVTVQTAAAYCWRTDRLSLYTRGREREREREREKDRERERERERQRERDTVCTEPKNSFLSI